MASAFLRTFRQLSALLVMVLVWAFLAVVYMEATVPRLEGFLTRIMPWKMLFFTPAEPTLEGRLAFMESLLDKSRLVATASFLLMAMSFVALSGYATYVYQQRQRRARENELLELKNQEIARRNEFIRYISATIGHEFKNNLSKIKRRMDMVEFPAEARERLYGNLDKLFADIDVFKKISDEREAGLVEFEPVDIRRMLDGFSRQFSDLAVIEFSGEAGGPMIFASGTLLRTVFENLIDNAVKYKKPEQERAIIRFSCSEELDSRRRYLTLSLRDEGVGMDEEQADSCFYRGKSARGGWGEGLYFAKYVVGLHAGKIKVGKEYTAPGRGTEIIINLPLVEETLDV